MIPCALERDQNTNFSVKVFINSLSLREEYLSRELHCQPVNEACFLNSQDVTGILWDG